jgi:hypothetical protein
MGTQNRGPVSAGKSFKQTHGYLLSKHFTPYAWTMCIWEQIQSDPGSLWMNARSTSLYVQKCSSYMNIQNEKMKKKNGAWDLWLWGSKALLNVKF